MTEEVFSSYSLWLFSFMHLHIMFVHLTLLLKVVITSITIKWMIWFNMFDHIGMAFILHALANMFVHLNILLKAVFTTITLKCMNCLTCLITNEWLLSFMHLHNIIVHLIILLKAVNTNITIKCMNWFNMDIYILVVSFL